MEKPGNHTRKPPLKRKKSEENKRNDENRKDELEYTDNNDPGKPCGGNLRSRAATTTIEDVGAVGITVVESGGGGGGGRGYVVVVVGGGGVMVCGIDVVGG